MTPSTARGLCFCDYPCCTENDLHLEPQETPTAATNVAREVQHDSFILSALQNGFSTTTNNVVRDTRRGDPKPSNKPKSDFR